MAQVPLYSGGVTPDSGPLVTQKSNVVPVAFGAGTAEGIGDIGAQTQRLGDVYAEHAIKLQEGDNKRAVDDGFTNLLTQQDQYIENYKANHAGTAAYENYGEAVKDLTKIREDVAAGMPNPKAQEDFGTASRRQLEYGLSDLTRYAATERKRGLMQSSEGLIEAAKNNYANAETDEQRADALAIIDVNREHQGKLLGDAPEFTDAKKFSDRSQAQKQYIERVMTTDPTRAQQLYDQYSGKPNFNTTQAPGLIAPGNIDPWNRQVLQNADGTYSTTSSFSREDPKTGREVLVPSVINGKRFSEDEAWDHYLKTGENLGQFKDADSADAYAEKLHNAQEARLDEHGNPKTGFTAPDSIVLEHGIKSALIPQQSRQIADAVIVPKSMDPEKDLPKWLADGADKAELLHPGDEVFAQSVATQIYTRANRVKASQQAVMRGGIDHIQSQLNDAEESGHILTLDDITSTPEGQAAWAAIRPTTQKAFLNQIRIASQGPRTPTPQGDLRFLALRGMSLTNPGAFSQLDLSHESSLMRGQRMQLAERQQAIIARKPLNEDVGKALSVLNANQMIQPQWPLAADKNSDDYRQFVGALEDKLTTFNAVHGRKPNDQDIKKLGQELLLAKKSGGFLGMFQSTTRSYQAPTPEFVQGITEAAKRAGAPPPTQAEIDEAYAARVKQ